MVRIKKEVPNEALGAFYSHTCLLPLGWGTRFKARGSISTTPTEIMVVGQGPLLRDRLPQSNGSIATITDKTTGQQVTLGSRYECLWGAVFPAGTPDYVGGCNFDAAWANRFSYAWSPAAHTLTLTYTPDPAASQQVAAQVVVTASEEPWVDLRLELQNDWGYELEGVLFPSDLVFVEADIEEALLPILPGVVFEPAFFAQDRSYTAKYPGYPGLFADYLFLSSKKGQISLYSLYDEGPIRPLVMGFIHDDAYVSDSTFYYHTFGVGIGDGQTWTTPGSASAFRNPPRRHRGLPDRKWPGPVSFTAGEARIALQPDRPVAAVQGRHGAVVAPLFGLRRPARPGACARHPAPRRFPAG